MFGNFFRKNDTYEKSRAILDEIHFLLSENKKNEAYMLLTKLCEMDLNQIKDKKKRDDVKTERLIYIMYNWAKNN